MSKAGRASKITEQEILNEVFDTSAKSLGVEQSFTAKNVTLSGCPAGNIVSTANFLHSVTFNQPVSNITTVLTHGGVASGTLIGTIVQPTGSHNPAPHTLTYDVKLVDGLAVSQVSPIATGNNITISYRI